MQLKSLLNENKGAKTLITKAISLVSGGKITDPFEYNKLLSQALKVKGISKKVKDELEAAQVELHKDQQTSLWHASRAESAAK
jgi:hypothetical protein